MARSGSKGAFDRPARLLRGRLQVGLAAVAAVAIFAIDILTPLDGAIAVLYTTVILLVAPLGARITKAAGFGTALLTLVAFLTGHLAGPTSGAYSRLAVSLVAITITTLLALRDRSTRTTLGEQARILELTHDTVIMRSPNDVILHWNDGAEQLYGWAPSEALGKTCADLLKCEFPADEVALAMEDQGQWSGEVVRTRRDGTRLVLASRWLLRRDPDGRPIGVIEASANLTEQRRADTARQVSERRYRTMFDFAGFATWESDWSETLRLVRESAPADEDLEAWLMAHPGVLQSAADATRTRTANQAAADLFGVVSPGDLVGSSLCGQQLPESQPAFAGILAALAGGGGAAESEIRFLTFDGRVIDAVLRVTVLPDGDGESRVLVMAVDVTERNEARVRIEQTSAELAHAARVSMLGQLAASIAHEVNQPLTAIITYCRSARRWLTRAEPNLEEVAGSLEKIFANGTRAADVIGRIRGLARKTPPRTEPLSLSDLVDDSLALVQREARAADVAIRKVRRGDLAPVHGDRVQVQQVIVNLLMNAIQATREVSGRKREICVIFEAPADGMAGLSVQDNGAGFAEGDAQRIFQPFFTTKAEGMGIGLSICRSIIEAQGGRIGAANNDGPGATVAFRLPIQAPAAAQASELIS